MTSQQRQELYILLERVCEQRATAQQWAQLEQLVITDGQARRIYVRYMQLHGSLHWDAGGVGAMQPTSPAVARRPLPLVRRRALLAGLVAASVMLLIGWGWLRPFQGQLAGPGPGGKLPPAGVVNDPAPPQPEIIAPRDVAGDLPRIRLTPNAVPAPVVEPPAPAIVAVAPNAGETDDEIVAFINTQLREAWNDNRVLPAPRATDEQLLRRTMLDLAGRIPTRREADQWLSDPRGEKQRRLVEQLLASGEFARHQSTVWTNLLVGRSPDQPIDRNSLLAWLDDGFRQNRPWNNTVTALLTAEGAATENGPVNYLLAHLNNQAVPATAITARILLCEQLQCAQCHTHPQVKEWGQERFWEMNAFFRNVAVVEPPTAVPGRRSIRRLVERNAAFRPSYYETLQGVMKVAYPKLGNVEFTTKPADPLREEFTRLLFAGDRPQPARAFVNRVWSQFFGHGFTTPVDDMGPHHPVSHPALLEGVTDAFVRSGYDVRRLTRWICLSDAYQLSSEAASSASASVADGPWQFERMAVKTLPAEPLYDSLRVAAGVAPEELSQAAYVRRRELWLEQFFRAMENDENSEATTLDGTLPQVLMMMNGDLVARATSLEPGTELQSITGQPELSESERLQQLSLAALSRRLQPEELQRLRDVYRQQVRQLDDRRLSAAQAQAEASRDIYWALLNSSEFTLNR